MGAVPTRQDGARDPLERVLTQLDGVRRKGAGYSAKCPAHDDRNPSLSVSTGLNGQVLLKCFAGCEAQAVAAAMGMKMSDLFPDEAARNGAKGKLPPRERRVTKPTRQRSEKLPARETRRVEYEIKDEEGTLVMIHERVEYDNGKKTYFWKQPLDGSYGLGGRLVDTLPLYGSERLSDLADGAVVVVTEGEKAADAVLAAGLNAVGTATGASAVPGIESLRSLQRFEIVLWPDNDDAGRAHMRLVAERLLTLEAKS